MSLLPFNRSDFLLTRADIPESESTEFLKIGHWNFKSSEPFYLAEGNHSTCLLIGQVYSASDTMAAGKEIAQIIAEDCKDVKNVATHIKRLSGRFVVVVMGEDEIKVFGDAMGQFEVYFDLGGSACASSIYLLKSVVQVRERMGGGAELYRNIAKTTRIQIGYTTKYVNVEHLMPNHYFDSKIKGQERYYPTLDDLENTVSLAEGAETIATEVKLLAQSISKTPHLALPVTGGNDSRILLGSFDKQDFECFIFDHPDSDRAKKDIKTARRLLDPKGRKLNVIRYSEKLDEEALNFYSDESRNPRDESKVYIWNAYKSCLENNVVLFGHGGEIGRSFFKKIVRPDAEKFAVLMGYPNNSFVIKEMQRWLDKLNYQVIEHENIMDIFYWEQRMGNWGARIITEVSLVTNVFSPMNSRYVLETMLRVPKKHRQFTGNALTKAIINKLDPTLLKVPINSTLKYRTFWLMIRLGIYDFYQNKRLEFLVKKGRKSRVEQK